MAVHITGEIIGELLGEQVDEIVTKNLSDILGIEHEESKDPLIIKALVRSIG